VNMVLILRSHLLWGICFVAERLFDFNYEMDCWRCVLDLSGSSCIVMEASVNMVMILRSHKLCGMC
jgi:hypothetical protein